MDTLEQTLKETIARYVGGGTNLKGFMFVDEARHAYAVVFINSPVYKHPPRIALMARMVEDKIVIETDITDRPLDEALVNNGVSREKIVLAYEDETVPTPHID